MEGEGRGWPFWPSIHRKHSLGITHAWALAWHQIRNTYHHAVVLPVPHLYGLAQFRHTVLDILWTSDKHEIPEIFYGDFFYLSIPALILYCNRKRVTNWQGLINSNFGFCAEKVQIQSKNSRFMHQYQVRNTILGIRPKNVAEQQRGKYLHQETEWGLVPTNNQMVVVSTLPTSEQRAVITPSCCHMLGNTVCIWYNYTYSILVYIIQYSM